MGGTMVVMVATVRGGGGKACCARGAAWARIRRGQRTRRCSRAVTSSRGVAISCAASSPSCGSDQHTMTNAVGSLPPLSPAAGTGSAAALQSRVGATMAATCSKPLAAANCCAERGTSAGTTTAGLAGAAPHRIALHRTAANSTHSPLAALTCCSEMSSRNESTSASWTITAPLARWGVAADRQAGGQVAAGWQRHWRAGAGTDRRCHWHRHRRHAPLTVMVSRGGIKPCGGLTMYRCAALVRICSSAAGGQRSQVVPVFAHGWVASSPAAESQVRSLPAVHAGRSAARTSEPITARQPTAVPRGLPACARGCAAACELCQLASKTG